MKKLSRGEVADVRAMILAKQQFKCAICGVKIRGNARGGATLDHCHETGYIRGVLCRSCNGGEGKVKNAAIRYGGGKDKWRNWLKSMLAYLSFHSQPRTSYLHPTWESEEDKRIKRNKKARIRRRAKQ